jgi:nicotinate-nucleotide adenylyltransferase
MNDMTKLLCALWWGWWKFFHRLRLRRYDKDRVIKIGLSMGTFNPIHNWHLLVAQCAWVDGGLDFVMIIPNGDPPHKEGTVSKFRRYRWVRGAARTNSKFQACPIETLREGKSYTVDTLRQLHAMYAAWGYKVELHLIIGMDNVDSIQSWHLAPEMLQLCNLLIAPRNSRLMTAEMIAAKLPGLIQGEDWRIIECPDSDVSSTLIRHWYEDERWAYSADYLVPNYVRKDIRWDNPWKPWKRAA